MFGIGKKERALYERLLLVLSDQVDWYRAQLQMVPPPHLRQSIPDTGVEADFKKLIASMGERGHYDEDEEMILEELRLGSLDLSDAEAALAQIGAINREIDFA